MVCLKAPELRMLKEGYGESYRDNFMASAQQLHSGSLTDDPEAQIAVANLATMPDRGEEDDGATLQAANTSMVMSMSSQDDSTIGDARADPPTESFIVHRPGSESFQAEAAEEFSAFPLQRMVSNDDEDVVFDDEFMNLSSISGPKAASGIRDEVTDPPADADLHALAARVAEEPDGRLSTLAAKVAEPDMSSRVEQSASDDLIGKCVTELQESFLEGSSGD